MALPETTQAKETFLSQVCVAKFGSRQVEFLPQLASIYYQTWAKENLCPNLETALHKLSRFDPEYTFVVTDTCQRSVYALIQTLPVELPSLAALPDVLPSYTCLEEKSMEHHRPPQPNYLLCFSINALPGFRIAAGGKTISLPRFLLENLPINPHWRRVAYSRFSHVPGGQALLDHYLGHLNDRSAQGAVWMHEAFGAITTQCLELTRPEDYRAGQGNVTVVYPKNPLEASYFHSLKAKRRLGQATFDQKPRVATFTDISL